MDEHHGERTAIMPKKICFVLPHFHLEFSGGAETQCYFIAKELLRRGWDVHYIRESAVREPSLMDGITVHSVPQRRKLFKWQNHFHLLSVMRRVGADVWYVRANPSYLPHVIWHARKTNSAAVWAFSNDSQFSYANKKIEGRVLHNVAAHLDHLLFAIALKYSDRIILQTEFQKRALAQAFGLSGEVIYNGHPLPQVESTRRENIVVWIARLHAVKSPERFIELSRHLQDPPIQCYLVGDSSDPAMREKVRAAAAALPNVHWLGRLSPDQVHELLSRARVLVSTSKSEGFSNTFIEAWMRGVPVISLHSDPDRLITQERLGYVDPDPTSAARRVRYLMENEEEWRRFSNNCKRFSRKHFCLSDAVDKLEACLDRIMSPRTVRRRRRNDAMCGAERSLAQTHAMHLHYLSDSVVPLAKADSIQVMKMCQAFSAECQSVTLFCLAPPKDSPLRAQNAYQYHRVKPTFVIERLEIPRIRWINRILYWLSLRRKIRAMAAPDLFYSRDIIALSLLCLSASIRGNLALEVHSPPPNRAWDLALRIIFRNSRFCKLVAISSALAVEYRRRYPDLLDDDKIIVAHDGADAAQIPENMLGRATATPACGVLKLGYIGSLYPGKGAEMIVALAAALPEYEFHVVGGDEDSIALWKRRGAGGNLQFHGLVSQERVYHYMCGFDVVLAPYRDKVMVGGGRLDIARWMSPLKIFEYMSGCKPIVASDLPVLREVLRHGENALLAKVDDVEDWVDKIRLLAADKALRNRIAQNAQQEFLRKYTWDQRASRILNAIQQRFRAPVAEQHLRSYTSNALAVPATRRWRRMRTYRHPRLRR